MAKTVIVFSPHNDDLEIGMGGTALKYIKEGYKVIKIVLSKGQLSNPHLRSKIVIQRREKEALKVSKKFKFTTIFCRLNDQKLSEELPNIRSRLLFLINKEKPEKIFFPTGLDLHPDHRAVFKFVTDLVKDIDVELYCYEVWSVVDEKHPMIYVDITDYLSKKLKMMDMFHTEKLSVFIHTLPVLYRSFKYGLKIKKKFAERFYKIR